MTSVSICVNLWTITIPTIPQPHRATGVRRKGKNCSLDVSSKKKDLLSYPVDPVILSNKSVSICFHLRLLFSCPQIHTDSRRYKTRLRPYNLRTSASICGRQRSRQSRYRTVARASRPRVGIVAWTSRPRRKTLGKMPKPRKKKSPPIICVHLWTITIPTRQHHPPHLI